MQYPSLPAPTLQLVRVNPRFRVIALGLPVPQFPGHPLDPPLRSRFQARDVNPPTVTAELSQIQVSPARCIAIAECYSHSGTEHSETRSQSDDLAI